MADFFRPPPRSVRELAQIVEETLSGLDSARELLTDRLSETTFKAAAYAMGVEVEGAVTIDSIGYALGRKINDESGVDLGNVLDGEHVKVKLERVAIKAVLLEMGVDAPANRDGLAQAMRTLIKRRMIEKLGDGVGSELLEGMGSLAGVAEILAAVARKNKPLIATDKAADNRRRQATYRASHRRVR